MPTRASDNAEAASVQEKTWTDPRALHAWDGDRQISDLFARTLAIKPPAWDIFLVYAPGVVWKDETPPAPTAWMHQLPPSTGADAALRFDPARFIESVKRIHDAAEAAPRP